MTEGVRKPPDLRDVINGRPPMRLSYLGQNKDFGVVHDCVEPVSNGDDGAVAELSLNCVLK